jgi:starch-binding outer membrane protein, SusD/RagB family
MNSKYPLLLICLTVFLTAACKKYIETSPNSNVQVPSNPAELQGLLDNQDVFGFGPALGLLSADEFYLSSSFYGDLSATEKNAYIWHPEIFGPAEIPHDWARAYQQIYYCNIALEGLNPLRTNTSDDKDLDKIKGDALFKRALSHFHLAQLFAPAYDEATADMDRGIPLKLQTDAKESVSRPSLRGCYDQILSDINNAEGLLHKMPDPFHRNRASNTAVLALKARILLYMGQWQQSAIAAEKVLKQYDSLIDFNSVDTTIRIPILGDNKEIIYSLKAPDIAGENKLVVGLASPIDGANIDTGFIHSFGSHDLRFPVFFRQRNDKTWKLRFTLTGTRTPFHGICVSEVYLTSAEAQARLGNSGSAITWLNKLLVNRYITGQQDTLPSDSDIDVVLERILVERQKELAFRGLRFMDIKRLNKQNRQITQVRKIGNAVYTIAPNDKRYALPLPLPTVEKYDLKPNPR